MSFFLNFLKRLQYLFLRKQITRPAILYTSVGKFDMSNENSTPQCRNVSQKILRNPHIFLCVCVGVRRMWGVSRGGVCVWGGVFGVDVSFVCLLFCYWYVFLIVLVSSFSSYDFDIIDNTFHKNRQKKRF